MPSMPSMPSLPSARVLVSRVLAVFRPRRRRRRDADLDAELSLHLDHLTEDHVRRGLSPDAARLAARRDLGGIAQVKDTYRDQRGLPFVDTLGQDTRYAVRTLRRSPAFALVVVLVLGLGIGANTAMFTFVNALLFRPLPGRAGELVGLYSHDRTQPDSYRIFSYPNYADIRDQADVFDGLTAYMFALTGIPSGDVTRRTFVQLVSSNYFATLGVPLATGRGFTAEEERPGAALRVVVTSYSRWKQAGLDPAFVGRTLQINTDDYTVVGVAPEGFTGTTALVAPELWLPLGVYDTVVNDIFKNYGGGLADRTTAGLFVAGRLKAGVSPAAAAARLEVVSRRLEEAYPGPNRHQLLTINPLPRVSTSSEPQSDTGLAVMSAVILPLSGAVLLIACLNIANMLLARGTARRKEIAIRVALGGGRARIVRQLLTESFILALAGAAVGLLLGYWSMHLLAASLTPLLPLPLQFDPRPDVRVLVATTVFAGMSTLFFGLGPALKLSRSDVVGDLKEVGGDTRGQGRRVATRGWLVVCQIAVSLTLMTAGGLFARAAMKASAADPGFRYDRELLVGVDPSLAGYDEVRGRASYAAVLDRVRSLPGVEAAGMASIVPFGDFHEGSPVERPGKTTADSVKRSPTYTIVGADYFRSLGLRMRRGREFTLTEEQSASAPRVAMIDETLARLLFPNEDPLGQEVRLAERPDETPAQRARTQPMQIVGVTPALRDELFDRGVTGHLYVPSGSHYRANMNIHVRVSHLRDGANAEGQTLDAIRRSLRALDSRLPVVELTTMRGFHDRGLVLWAMRAAGKTLTGFGALALLLAAIGVYGVKSYVVSQRTREIGIRMALGATSTDVLWMVLRDGARLTLLGLVIGFPLAIGLALFLSRVLVGVSPLDPLVLTLAPATLAAAAAVATYVPARRATRVMPLDALHAE